MLSPRLHSVPQFPAALASPKSDPSLQLSSASTLCSSSPSLCCYLESTSQQKVRVIIALTSFVFSLTGITILCSLYSKQNIVVSYIFYPVFYLFTACYSSLAEADISNPSFLPCLSLVQHTPNYYFPTLCQATPCGLFFPALVISFPSNMTQLLCHLNFGSLQFSLERDFFLFLCLYSILFTHTTAFISISSICMSPH